MLINLEILAFTVPQFVWDLFLSLSIFATVVLLVVGIFRQPAEMKISHQRRSVIETGHQDRKTVFENHALKPVMWVMLVLAYASNLIRVKHWLNKTLIASGNPNYYTAEEYLALSLFYGFVLALLSGGVYLVAYSQFSLIMILAGFGAGIVLTIYQLWDNSRKRLREITRRIPYSLDLIALAMAAGATFVEAVETIAHEDNEDPFSAELRAMLAEMELGSTRRQALKNIAQRVPIDMLQSIIASIIQAEQLGTPLSQVLHSQATLLRMQRSVRAENAAAVASIRILIPSMLILISVVIAVFGPAIMRFISNGGLF